MGLLDLHTGSKSALALWQLTSSFTLEPIKVQRVSDGVQQWIPFDASGYASESALNTFLGPENDPTSEQEAFIVDVRNQVDSSNGWAFIFPEFYGARIRVGGVNVKGVNGKLGMLLNPTPYGDALDPTSQMDIHTNGFTGVFNIELYDTNTSGQSKYLYRNTSQSPNRGIFIGYRDGKFAVYHRNAAGGTVNEAHDSVAGQNLTIDIAVNEAQSSKLLRHNGVTFNSIQSWSLTYPPNERIGDTNSSRAPWLLFQCGILWDEFRADSAAIGDAVKAYFDVTPPVSLTSTNATLSSPNTTNPSLQAFAPEYNLSVPNLDVEIQITNPGLSHTAPNFTLEPVYIETSPPEVSVPSATFTDLMSISSEIVGATCATCADGSIVTTVSAVNTPVTYLWNTGGTDSFVTNVVPGIYTLTVTDNLGFIRVFEFEVGLRPPDPISIFESENFGQIASVEFLAVSGVTYEPPIYKGMLIGDYLTHPTASWVKLYYTPGEAEFDGGNQISVQGDPRSGGVDLLVPKRELEKTGVIRSVVGVPVIVRIALNNGGQIYVGSVNYPSIVRVSMASSDRLRYRNHYSIRIKCLGNGVNYAI